VTRWLRRSLSRLHHALRGDRRTTADRTPVFIGARLDLDVVSLTGTARDLSSGGVFFATAAPLAPGVRGQFTRPGRAPVPVQVRWRRDHAPGQPAGIGLSFE